MSVELLFDFRFNFLYFADENNDDDDDDELHRLRSYNLVMALWKAGMATLQVCRVKAVWSICLSASGWDSHEEALCKCLAFTFPFISDSTLQLTNSIAYDSWIIDHGIDKVFVIFL